MRNISNRGARDEGWDSLDKENDESKDNTNLSVNKNKKKPGRKASGLIPLLMIWLTSLWTVHIIRRD